MTKVSEKEILKTPVFTVVEKEFKETAFKPVGLNCPDWAMLIALDSNSSKTIVVKQTRWGKESQTIEFPCGTCEPGESALYTAIRELKEETGIQVSAEDVTHLGDFNPNPAYFNNKMHVFVYNSKDLKKDFENRLEPELDSTEDCFVELADFEELLKDDSPFLDNSITLAALGLLASKYDKECYFNSVHLS